MLFGKACRDSIPQAMKEQTLRAHLRRLNSGDPSDHRQHMYAINPPATSYKHWCFAIDIFDACLEFSVSWNQKRKWTKGGLASKWFVRTGSVMSIWCTPLPCFPVDGIHHWYEILPLYQSRTAAAALSIGITCLHLIIPKPCIELFCFLSSW